MTWGLNKIWGPGMDLRIPWKIFSLRPCRIAPPLLFLSLYIFDKMYRMFSVFQQASEFDCLLLVMF